MYKLYYSNDPRNDVTQGYPIWTCFYTPIVDEEKFKITDCVLSTEANAAGSLEFTMHVSNIGYNGAGADPVNSEGIVPMVSQIKLERDGNEIWSGRVISSDIDFYNSKIMYCEGELAYLNDTTQPPAKYNVSIGVPSYIRNLINIHNGKVTNSIVGGFSKRFLLSADIQDADDDNPSTDETVWETDWNTTMDCFSNIVDSYNGYFYVTKGRSSDNKWSRYLHYISAADLDARKNNPVTTIEFGKNLIDFTRSYDWSEYSTVIVPLGKQEDDAYVTVSAVNGGSPYVLIDQNMVQQVGWIEKVIQWDNIVNPTDLYNRAIRYLQDQQFDDMSIEITAVDFYDMGINSEPIKLMDYVRVIARPHGLDKAFPVTAIKLNITNPGETTYTLGKHNVTSYTELTKGNIQTSRKDSLS